MRSVQFLDPACMNACGGYHSCSFLFAVVSIGTFPKYTRFNIGPVLYSFNRSCKQLHHLRSPKDIFVIS